MDGELCHPGGGALEEQLVALVEAHVALVEPQGQAPLLLFLSLISLPVMPRNLHEGS